MKSMFLFFFLAIASIYPAHSQKYFTKNGHINFDATSKGSPERIEGVNKTATCVLDTKTGAIQFAVLMKGFEFERALMEEHFNENYVESEKFPKAEFKGVISNNDKIDYSKDGTYTATVKGQLQLHGQSREVQTDGKITVQNGKISAAADFQVQLSDFNISVPGLVADKLSKTAKISVTCSLELLKI